MINRHFPVNSFNNKKEQNERQKADRVVIFYGYNSFTFESEDKKCLYCYKNELWYLFCEKH